MAKVGRSSVRSGDLDMGAECGAKVGAPLSRPARRGVLLEYQGKGLSKWIIFGKLISAQTSLLTRCITRARERRSPAFSTTLQGSCSISVAAVAELGD